MVAFLFVYYSMKQGEIKQIPNTLRKFGEAEGYSLMYDSEGKGYIFTKEQLQYAGDRYNRNPEDVIPFTEPTDYTFAYVCIIVLLLLANFVQAAVYF